MAVRKQICSLEVKVADLEKLRQKERFEEDIIRDLSDSPTPVLKTLFMESGSFMVRGHLSEEEGCDPFRTSFLSNGPTSSHPNDTLGVWVEICFCQWMIQSLDL